MCTFRGKITDKEVVTGYKMAVVDNKTGLYYSPATGIPYKVGKVPVATTYGNNELREKLGFTDILNKKNPCFKKEYAGKTAVYKELHNALNFKYNLESFIEDSGYSLVILEMELSGDLYNGDYQWSSVYIGSEIVSIKLIN
jgi:hypothetical protein